MHLVENWRLEWQQLFLSKNRKMSNDVLRDDITNSNETVAKDKTGVDND